MIQFLYGMVLNTTGLFYTPVSEAFHLPLNAFGLYPTIMTVIQGCIMVFVEKIFSKYSTRISLSAAILSYASSCLLRAAAPSIMFFYISGVIQSFGNAMLAFVIAPMLTQNWFAKNQGKVLGVCTAAQGLGATLFSLAGGSMLDIFGWRICFLFQGLILLAIGLPITFFVIRKKPSDIGLLPVGCKEDDAYKKGQSKKKTVHAQEEMRTLSVWLILIFAAGWAFMNAFHDYINSYTISIGYSVKSAAAIMAFSLVGLTMGRVVHGIICDIGLWLDIISTAAGFIISLLLLNTAGKNNLILVLIASFLFGWFYAGLNIVAPLMVKKAFGEHNFCSLWPVVCMGESFVGAVGYTLWGSCIEDRGYPVTMCILGFLCIIIMSCGMMSMYLRSHARKEIRVCRY